MRVGPSWTELEDACEQYAQLTRRQKVEEKRSDLVAEAGWSAANWGLACPAEDRPVAAPRWLCWVAAVVFAPFSRPGLAAQGPSGDHLSPDIGADTDGHCPRQEEMRLDGVPQLAERERQDRQEEEGQQQQGGRPLHFSC